jgi:hypothetical protein
MRCGSAIVDITPARNLFLGGGMFGRATGVNDRLTATAFCFEHDGARLLLINCDLIGFGNDLANSIRTDIGNATGLPRDAIALSATHTHSGPVTLDLRHWGSTDKAYAARLRRLLVRVAQQATARTVPVRLKWSSMPCRGIGVNRTSYGTVVDETLGVLRVEKATDGRLLGMIVNHACHPVTMHSTRVYSADFPGAIRAEVRRVTRRTVPVVFLLGAAGDTNPRDFKADLSGSVTPQLMRARRALCHKIGAELARCALGNPARKGGTGLAWSVEKVSLPLQPYPDAATLRSLKMSAEADIRKYRSDPEKAWPLAEALVMRDWVRDAASRRGARSLQVELAAIRIGRVRILALPVELFAAYGLELRRRMGRVPFILATMCNGYNSYVTADPGIERRTYEAAGVPRLLGRQSYAKGVGRRLVAGAVRVARKLGEEGG